MENRLGRAGSSLQFRERRNSLGIVQREALGNPENHGRARSAFIDRTPDGKMIRPFEVIRLDFTLDTRKAACRAAQF